MGPSAAAISATATIKACRSVTSTAAWATVAPSSRERLGEFAPAPRRRGRSARSGVPLLGQGDGRGTANSVGRAREQYNRLDFHRVVFTTRARGSWVVR